MESNQHLKKHGVIKKVKEYFLEFLMMFLAVTLGFFAESLRETMNDKAKEKEYIGSLIKNLQDDTTRLNYCIKDNESKLDGLHQLMSLSVKNLSEPENRKLFYKYCSKSIAFYSIFKSNDATMEQLKNSGGLRYIRRSHVADSIAKYDNEVKSVYSAEGLYMNASDLAILAAQEVLDQSIYYDTSYFRNGGFTNKFLPFISNDPQKIKWLFNRLSFETGATKNYIENLHAHIPFAAEMIDFLRKEYEIE